MIGITINEFFYLCLTDVDIEIKDINKDVNLTDSLYIGSYFNMPEELERVEICDFEIGNRKVSFTVDLESVYGEEEAAKLRERLNV